MRSASVELVEEARPVSIAADFMLQDFDSPDSPGTTLTVTLTLTQAVDEESEGVSIVTDGGVTMTEQASSEQFTKVYTLTGGTSYSQYQQVCCC